VDRTQWIVAAGAVLVAAFAGVLFGRPPEPPPLAPPTTVAEATITVHVSGLVAQPGLVALPIDARVGDAIAAAGGLVPGTDPAIVNLAAHVVDGQQVVVVAGQAPSPADGRIALNRAGADELQQVPGIGPVLAARIVAYRDQNGPFSVVEDLLEVAGIGEAKLAAIRDHIAVP
jgi:competence protein ComEA